MMSRTEGSSTLQHPDGETLPAYRRMLAVLSQHGHIILAILGSSLFLFTRPPVADLQAADARAAAAARGVGPSYWLNWFAGSAPGGYSVLAPKVGSWLGVATAAAASVVLIALLARPLLAGTHRPRTAAYLVAICALGNLWSGRIAFSLGAAVSVAALVLLRRDRAWLGGVLNGLAALLSPLAPAFVLIGLSGPFLLRPDWRPRLLRFIAPSLLGLAVPPLLFGAPGAMSYAFVTLTWTVVILLAASLLRLPPEIRLSLLVGVAVAVVVFLVPNGVGANIGRYAFLVMPPLVWSVARAPKRLIALALVPALIYSGYQVIGDVHRASAPEAQPQFYRALKAELTSLPTINNHRVEVIDTSTHRADVELVPAVYLARGWENQSDASANPLFWSGRSLTPQVYRQWLESAAVAWIAVPVRPLARNADEAALVTGGLPYLHEIWHDSNWRLYAVADPQPIVAAPARLLHADETSMLIDVPTAGTVTMRIRASRYLTLTRVDDPTVSLCLVSDGAAAVSAAVTSPGQYLLASSFDALRAVGSNGCPAPR